jgi:hypothetical protein
MASLGWKGIKGCLEFFELFLKLSRSIERERERDSIVIEAIKITITNNFIAFSVASLTTYTSKIFHQ